RRLVPRVGRGRPMARTFARRHPRRRRTASGGAAPPVAPSAHGERGARADRDPAARASRATGVALRREHAVLRPPWPCGVWPGPRGALQTARRLTARSPPVLRRRRRPRFPGVHIAGLRELGFLGFLKKLYKRWSDNAITDRAAQLAYYFLFALFPFLFFLVTLTAYLPLQSAAQDLVSRLEPVMPDEAMGIVRGQFDKLLTIQRPRLLTFSLALALWSASRGVDAIRTALNLAYDVKETRPWWKTQGMALAITILGALLVLVSVA